MDLKNKNILITGGTLGIGKETARLLVEKGANVLITGRSNERIQDSIKDTKAKGLVFDIADIDQIAENSKKRLRIMESTNDGFVISDEDLKMRGPGEFFGIKAQRWRFP